LAFSGDTITLDYTPGGAPIQAADDGTDAAALSNQAVTNNSTQTPPGGDTANIFVDANGGTCADNASLVAYSDAAACGSIDAANDTCDNGDVVRIVSLPASNQAVSGGNSRTSDCLFRPQTDGNSVSLNGSLTITGSRMTMTGIHQTIDTDDYLNILLFASPASNVTVNDATATRVEAGNGTSDILVNASDFGPCISSYGPGGPGTSTGNQGVCNNRVTGTATRVTYQFSNLHGNLQEWNGSAGPNGEAPHSECLAIFGSISFSLIGSKLWDCGDSANTLVQQDGAGQKATNLRFIGNWFNLAWNAVDGTATQEKCTGLDMRYNTATGGADMAGTFEFSWNVLNRCLGSGGQSGLEIPWLSTNSGDGNRYAPLITSARYVGNVGTTVAGGGGGGCPTNSGNNYIDYNVQMRWDTGNNGYLICGSNSTTITSQSFLTNSTQHGAFDFHVTGTTQGWENTVPTSVTGGCPINVDRVQQPVTGTLCDPGTGR
jgi:hypothetical protein